jgi:hypothetical protein
MILIFSLFNNYHLFQFGHVKHFFFFFFLQKSTFREVFIPTFGEVIVNVLTPFFFVEFFDWIILGPIMEFSWM